jgi:hypothetical protein
MGFPIGILLIAVGAVLAWAVNWTSPSINIHVVGIILFVVGLVATLVSTVFWSSWAGPGHFSRSRETYDDDRGGHKVVTRELQGH